MNLTSHSIASGSKTPAFRIHIADKDVTSELDKRLINLTLTDNRGFVADDLTLTLDDADGQIVMPRLGAVLHLELGWKGQALCPKGSFVVDAVTLQGSPDTLSITARSADFSSVLSQKHEHTWHETTLGAVVKDIAGKIGLKPALSDELKDKPIDHIDQTNESDGSFLVRLASRYGAIAAIKDGHLLFMPQGEGRTASGKLLPIVALTRRAGDGHVFDIKGGTRWTGVSAHWLDTREPEKKKSQPTKGKQPAISPTAPEASEETNPLLVGESANPLVLNRTYANRGDALQAAKAQWERIRRGVSSFTLLLAEGRAELYTEMMIKVSGFKAPIDDETWIISKLTHNVTADKGFATSMELERRLKVP